MPNRRQQTGQLVLSALLTAMIAICAQISLPIPPVPASLSMFAVLLCGAVLGPVWGTLSVCAYVFMGAIGLPVFAGFQAGPSILFGPTGGYLVGYILSAFAVGALSCRMPYTVKTLFAMMALSLLLCYIPGTLWLKAITRVDWLTAVASGVIMFIPGDLAKAFLASLLAVRLRRSLPHLNS